MQKAGENCAVTLRQGEGVALVLLGLASLVVTRWPRLWLARLLLTPRSGPAPPNDRAVRYVRYLIFSAVVLFGVWLAAGH